jgi:hypothetical protein
MVSDRAAIKQQDQKAKQAKSNGRLGAHPLEFQRSD